MTYALILLLLVGLAVLGVGMQWWLTPRGRALGPANLAIRGGIGQHHRPIACGAD